MSHVDLIPVEQTWCCRDCSTRMRARTGTRTPLHECPAHNGIRLPMLAEGEHGDLRLNVRDDYVGKEDVVYDEDGQPIMSAEIVREDGNDVWAYAPAARVEVKC
jgi:hypothetical protein